MLLSKGIELFRDHMTAVDKAEDTIKGYFIELRQFNRFAVQKYNGPVYLHEITVQDLEDYMQMRKIKGDAASSRSRSVYILRAFYSFCVKKEYILNNISQKLEIIPVQEKERVYLTEEEFKVLEAAVKPAIAKLILNSLFYTGMRISECLNLSLQDVDLKIGVITVRNTKSKRDRLLPIHKDLKPLLQDYLNTWRQGNACRYFFTANNKNRVSPDYINRVLHETTQTLGWNKKVTCHSIRHSFASRLVENNVNIVNIQKLLGHSDLSTTSIYTHTNMIELFKAVNSI